MTSGCPQTGPGHRRQAPAVALVLLLAGCGSSGPPPAAGNELLAWADGPVRWLLLPEEWKELRQMRHKAAALNFIESFWARRDGEPETPGNAFRERFSERVEAADLLYKEGARRGSLTDRGRALILLGPPSHVRVGSEPALSWSPAGSSRPRVTTRELAVEVWGYRLEDLPLGLVEASVETEREVEQTLTLTLTFVADDRGTRLADGENLLELARRAAVRSE